MTFSVCVINQSIHRLGIYFGFSYFFKNNWSQNSSFSYSRSL